MTAVALCYFRRRKILKQKDKEDKKDLSLSKVNEISKSAKKYFPPIPVNDFFTGNVLLERKNEYDFINENDKLLFENEAIQGTTKKNQGRNRNRNIVAYDFNRVKVDISKSSTDYINASWIRKLSSDLNYDYLNVHPYLPCSQMNIIVTQNPTKDTIELYYSMLHEQKIDFVIYLSHYKVSTEDVINQVSISKKVLNRNRVNGSLAIELWDINKIKEGINKGSSSQIVRFLTFSGWAMKGTISDETIRQLLVSLSLFRKEIGNNRENVNLVLQDEFSGSSGAAVFIALLELLEKIDDCYIDCNTQHGVFKGEISIFELVRDLRNKRAKMIHSYEEYQLLYRALIQYSQNKQEYDEILRHKRKSLLSCEKQFNVGNIENPLITRDADGNEFFDGYKVYDYTGVNIGQDDSVVYVIPDDNSNNELCF